MYSLGLVGYFLLTGKNPFNLEKLDKTVEAQLEQIPQSPSILLDKNISPDLDGLILQCLEKDMDKRPANARSFFDSLDVCQTSENWDRSRAEEWWDENNSKMTALPVKDSEMDSITRTMTVDMMFPRDQDS